MNRYDRVKEHLDGLDISSLRFCTAGGPCACMGCAGTVNGSAVREHELIKYVLGTLVPGQKRRSEIEQREREQLVGYGDPRDYSLQYGHVKKGEVWGAYLNKNPLGSPPTLDIQLTGRFNKGLKILSYLQ
jgi:hypothetical protein